MDFFTCSAASQGWVSALGHKRIRTAIGHVRFTPKADILHRPISNIEKLFDRPVDATKNLSGGCRLSSASGPCHARPAGRDRRKRMAQEHSKQAAHSHMHDFKGHIEAAEADLEYWRTKRLEPRLIQLHRRGVLTFYDLVRTAAACPAAPTTA